MCARHTKVLGGRRLERLAPSDNMPANEDLKEKENGGRREMDLLI